MEKLKILCYHTSVKITLMRDPIVPNRKGKNSMEQFFKLKEHGTDVKMMSKQSWQQVLLPS